MSKSDSEIIRKLQAVHRELEQCERCPRMTRPSIHGPAIDSRVLLFGQAPGPHEAKFMRPFAWTSGRTLFKWFKEALGWDEDEFRARIYVSAVARCFPGKASSRGDRRPDPVEVKACSSFIKRETHILQPELIIPVGTLAIEQVLQAKLPLDQVVGRQLSADFYDVSTDVIALPHPSGASPWPRVEPGKTLLKKALDLIKVHPAMQR